MSLADVDLTDPGTFHRADLADHWRALRRDDPVHWHPWRDGGFWVLTRYDDVVDLYRAGDAVSSERGNVLDTLLGGGDSASGQMLAVTDGERHRAIRKQLVRSFTPRALAELTRRIERRTADVVDRALQLERFDFAREVADRLPIEAICDLMDVPPADRPSLLDWNKSALSSDDPAADPLDSVLARQEILLYFGELAQARRAAPGTDVVSALAAAVVDGEPLTGDELALNCYSLILGGDESSRMSAVTGVRAFADHPEQWQLLRAAETVESAVEEVLRWSTPSMHFARTATRPITLHGTQIRAGDVVSLWNCSADFDEAAFEAPERFDVGREPNAHVAFGHGRHFCLGAFLARTELRALFAALRRRVRRIELAGEPRQVFSNFLFGYSSLPVQLRAA